MTHMSGVSYKGVANWLDTQTTLNGLGLLCWSDPVAYKAVESPISTGQPRRHPRRCRGNRNAVVAVDLHPS